MTDTPTAAAIALALMTLSLTVFGLTVSLIHVRRRHRALKKTLTRVRAERDEARRVTPLAG